MEQNSTFAEFESKGKIIARRRDLLPLWIKIFTWIFLIFGIVGLIIPILGSIYEKLDLSLYGLSTTQVFSSSCILITALFIFKGIVAFGLWFEKDWGPQSAIFDAILGIIICGYCMLIDPLVSGNMNINIRLELIPLIFYFLKMRKIQNTWVKMKFQ